MAETLGAIRVSVEVIEKMLALPPGCKVVSIEWREGRPDPVRIVVRGPLTSGLVSIAGMEDASGTVPTAQIPEYYLVHRRTEIEASFALIPDGKPRPSAPPPGGGID